MRLFIHLLTALFSACLHPYLGAGEQVVEVGACALMMPSRATVIATNPLALLRCTGVHAPAWSAMGTKGQQRFHDGRPVRINGVFCEVLF